MGRGETDANVLDTPESTTIEKTAEEAKAERRLRRKKRQEKRRESVDGLQAVNALLFQPDPNNVGEDIKKGMHDLLALHNVHELKTLCHALDIDSGGTRSGRLARVYEYAMCDLASTREVLQLMWEGTLVEYLRSVGFPMRGTGEDPRKTVMRYWIEIRKPAEPEVTPCFLPRTQRPPNKEVTNDTRILDLLEDLRQQEQVLKKIEREVRTTQDPAKITPFLQAITTVRKTEEIGRNYLVDTLETLHAKEYHTDQAIAVTTAQLKRVEQEHEDLVRDTNLKTAQSNVLGNFTFKFFGEAAARAASLGPRWKFAQAKMKGELALLQSQVARSHKALGVSAKSELAAIDALTDLKRRYGEVEEVLNLTKDKIVELWNRMAYFDASDETTIDVFFDLACDGEYQAQNLDFKIRQAAEISIPLLRAPNPNPKVPRNHMREYAEKVLLSLAIFTEDEMMCKKNQIAMWTEELEQKRIEAVRAAKDPKNKKKKKAGKKGKKKRGAKGGKGDKKGKKKKKKKK